MSSSSLISLLLCFIYCLASVVFLISTILFLKVLCGYFSDNLGCFDDLLLHVYFCDSNFNFLKQLTSSYFILYLSNNSNFWVICYLSLFLVFLSSGPHWHTLTCFNFCYKGKCGVEWSGEGKYVWVINKNGCWKIKQNAPSTYQPPNTNPHFKSWWLNSLCLVVFYCGATFACSSVAGDTFLGKGSVFVFFLVTRKGLRMWGHLRFCWRSKWIW